MDLALPGRDSAGGFDLPDATSGGAGGAAEDPVAGGGGTDEQLDAAAGSPVASGGASAGGSGGASGATPRQDAAPPVVLEAPVVSVRWHFDGALLQWSSRTTFAHFAVQRRVANASAFTPIGEVKGKVTTFTDIAAVDEAPASYVVVGRTDLGQESRSAEVQFVRGRNHVANPGFERDGVPVQTLAGWLTWSPPTSAPGDNADFIADDVPARSGKYFAVHAAAPPFTVSTFQKFAQLPPGRYGARGFFARAAAAVSGLAAFGVKPCAGGASSAIIELPRGPSGWVELAIEFNAAAGICYELFVYSENVTGGLVRFDDIGLFRIAP